MLNQMVNKAVVTRDNLAVGKVSQEKEQSVQSTSMLATSSIESLRSKKSFGFVPSIRSVAPLSNRNGRGTQNFLMFLDTLEAIDEDETKRKKPAKVYTVASQSGIEANSSDETASQTFIGRPLDGCKEPGKIQLSLIKAQD